MSATPEREQAEARTLEEILAAGQVRSALILKGDFSEDEQRLIKQAYETGIEHGKSAAVERERELTRALADAKTRVADLEKLAGQLLAREALAGGVSAAGRPTEQDCPCPPAFKRVAYCDDCPERQEPGGGTAAVAEAGE